MKFRALAALLLFAAPVVLMEPAFAQRGGGHGGASASRGFAGSGFEGHAGMSAGQGFSRPGVSRPSSFVPSAPAFRNGTMAGRGYARFNPGLNREFNPRGNAGFRFSNSAGRVSEYRPEYRSQYQGRAATPFRAGDRDRDRFGERRREFNNWRANIYPLWLGYGYPYTLDPGFVDWGDTRDSAYAGPGDNAAYDQGPLSYPAPYPDQEDQAEGRQPYAPAESTIASAPASAGPAPGEPLTLIFKDGRAPVKIENYMMTATVLTDLDPQRYAKIPLDQIDLAATQQANSAAGVEFQVPGTTRD